MGEKWGKMGKKWVKNEITGVQKTVLMHASARLGSAEAVAAAEEALAAALAVTVDPTATNTQQELVGKYRAAWRKWQKVRQALSPPAFDEWVYPDEHDEYHFSHSPAVLQRLVDGEASSL